MEIVTPLQAYLLTPGKSPETLNAEFGVNFKRHPRYHNLVQFCYDQIESAPHKTNPIVKGCRGHILDEARAWRYVARPFDRFFNVGEPHADNVDFANSVIQEKVDGSLCIVYYYDNKWHVATKGMPDAGGDVGGCGFTFAELFWKIAKLQGIVFDDSDDYMYPTPFSSQRTYLFELTSPYNKVVVTHKDSKLTFLGTYHNRVSDFCSPNIYFYRNYPELNPVKEFKFNSMEDMVAFANTINGLDGEGFVVLDNLVRRVKVKSESYLALAHMREGFGPRRVLEVVRTGEADEVQAYIKAFPEWKAMFAEVSEKYEALVAELEQNYEKHRNIEVQKDFALAVKDCRCNAALFKFRAGKVSSFRKYLADMNVRALLETLRIKDLVVTLDTLT